jgi:hypothetical protein
VVNEGIVEPGKLVTYTHYDIKTFFKHLARRGAHSPFGALHNFQILRYWVEKRTPSGLEVSSDLFTDEELLVWGEKMKAAADEKDEQRLSIPAPNAFKKDTKWSV